MATWYQIQARRRKQTERLAAKGFFETLPADKPLLLTGGKHLGRKRGRTFFTNENNDAPPKHGQ